MVYKEEFLRLFALNASTTYFIGESYTKFFRSDTRAIQVLYYNYFVSFTVKLCRIITSITLDNIVQCR